MASSSSSTSAPHEIEEAEEDTKQIPNPSPEKTNGVDNVEKADPKSLSPDPNNEKASILSKLLKRKSKKPKNQKSPKENTPNQAEEDKKVEEEAKAKKLEEEAKKLEEELKEKTAISNLIHADLTSIKNASDRYKKHAQTFDEVQNKFDELKEVADAKELREFKKVVKSLKQQISAQDKSDSKEEEEALTKKLEEISKAKIQAAKVQKGIMPNLFSDSDFVRTLQFKDFKARYNELPLELKLCLLCFSVFPEDEEIKRRVMVYWWIGEEFVPPRTVSSEDRTDQDHLAKYNPFFKECWDNFHLKSTQPEESTFTPEKWASERWANFYFSILLEMGFIESAQKKPNPKVDTCKMHPFVRTMLNRIAQEAKFFEFDGDGFVNEEFSNSLRACLLNSKKLPEDNKLLGKIHAIFNVDKEILDFKHDSLANMRNANVLYLGRWQNIGTHHIEVDDTKILNAKGGNILDGLQNIRNLKFLSFQGISRITELPRSVLKLKNLTILDIRACHNLEKIPDDIGCLVNLTHLDMSECFLLDEMPKGISLLTNLQVLSGFVVAESANKKTCTLEDLRRFSHLRKLSIHTGSVKFPTVNDLKALNQFRALRKLTIAWGRGSANTDKEHSFTRSMTEVKEDSNTGDQGDGEATSANKQTPKTESEEKITKGAEIRTQNIAQSPKKDIKEVEREGKAVTQSREIIEVSQGSQEPDIGKESHRREMREVETVPNQGSQEAIKKVGFPADVIQKESEKNKGNSLAQKFQSPKQKQIIQKRSLGAPITKIPISTRIKGICAGQLGSGIKQSMRSMTRKYESIPSELPSHLTKLDLQSLPETPLTWLNPLKLKELKKLYIRGGKLADLGQFQDLDNDTSDKPKWHTVEELRLKYLDELEMDWRELLELFPKLDYMEKVHCPKLSFFPCNEIGVWTKEKIIL